MRHIREISVITFVCVVGWQIGGKLTPAQAAMVPGLVFGFVFAIGVSAIALTVRRNARIDVRIRISQEMPMEAKRQPQRLSVQPTRYTVVISSPKMLEVK